MAWNTSQFRVTCRQRPHRRLPAQNYGAWSLLFCKICRKNHSHHMEGVRFTTHLDVLKLMSWCKPNLLLRCGCHSYMCALKSTMWLSQLYVCIDSRYLLCIFFILRFQWKYCMQRDLCKPVHIASSFSWWFLLCNIWVSTFFHSCKSKSNERPRNAENFDVGFFQTGKTENLRYAVRNTGNSQQ